MPNINEEEKKAKELMDRVYKGMAKYKKKTGEDFREIQGVQLFSNLCVKNLVNKNNWLASYVEVTVKVTKRLEELGLLEKDSVLK